MDDLGKRLVDLRNATLEYKRAEARRDWAAAVSAADRMISASETDREIADASYAFDRASRMTMGPLKRLAISFGMASAHMEVKA